MSSCSWFQQQQPEEKQKQQEPPPVYLGTIDQVYPEKNFALVRLIAPMPEPGTTLISHPADGSMGRVGNLSVSSERVDSLRLAADIRGGTVMRGDYVFAYKPLSEPSAKTQQALDDAPSDEMEDDTPLPEVDGLLPASGPGSPAAVPVPVPAAVGASEGISEAPLPPAREAPAPTAPSPTGPQAPQKAPSSLDDIADTLDDL